jgi:arylsulfatase
MALTGAALAFLATGSAFAQEAERPNIRVIWGDDVGWTNLSTYGDAIMGYRTPNIDRLADKENMFVDHYAQPSCTAGRAAFITGQYPIRSGMTTVGQPGSTLGLQAESPTLAEQLKQIGYRTRQFGKNHLGDRNEHLPTVHGFDEFFGNLYHLNTQEESEQRDYRRFGAAFSGDLEAYEGRFGTRACCTPSPRMWRTPPRIHASESSASRPSRIPVPSPRCG